MAIPEQKLDTWMVAPRLSDLTDPAAFEAYVRVIDWFIDEFEEATRG